MMHQATRAHERNPDWAEDLLIGQTQIVELIATGAPLSIVLDRLARFIECRSSGLTCAILLLDSDGRHLRVGAAPTLPIAYRRDMDGMQLDPTIGSWGAAIYRRMAVRITDTARDPLWHNLREFANRYGIRSSWSTPILSTSGDVLGAFALHFCEPREPVSSDYTLVELAIHLARIAIERDRIQREHARLVQERVARVEAEAAGQRVAGILESITDAFFAFDEQGRLTYLNREAQRILAQVYGRVRTDLIGKRLHEELPDLIVNQFAEQYRRVIVERKPVEFETHYARLDRWYEVRAYPGEGEVSVYFREITARKRAENALQLLARTGSLLSASLDYATTLRQVVHLSVPGFADRCTVFLVGDDQRVRAIEVACADPSQTDMFHRALRYFLDDPGSADNPVVEAIRTGQSTLATDVAPESVQSFAHDEEHLQMIRRLNVTSFIVVPLMAHGRALGAISFALSGTRRRYTQDDLVVAEEIARRCAMALDNARLYHEASAAKEELRRQLDFTRAVTQSAGTGIYAVDPEGRTTFANPAAERLLGWSLDELLGRLAHETVHFRRPDGSPYPASDCPIVQARQMSESAHCDEDTFIRKDGSLLPVSYTSTPIVSNDRVLGTVVSFEDISERKRAEDERARLVAAVEQERSILAATMASMRDGLIVVDRDRRVCYFNQCAAEILRVDPRLVLGRCLDDILDTLCMNVENPAKAVAVFADARASIEQHPGFEVVVEGPPRRDVVVELFPVVDTAGTRVGGAALLRDVTGAKLLASLQERERIAMDLHDGVIQSLYGVSLGLGSRERMLGEDQATTRAALRQVRIQIGGVIQMIRNYIFDLRLNELGERGLRAGLESLAEELRVNTLVRSVLVLDEDVEQYLTPPMIAQILQIAREATSNVIRHAGAQSVTIRVVRARRKLILTISDDGRGFVTRRRGSGSGHGIRNMATRARGLGGNLTVRSVPGQGTVIRVDIPLRKATE